MSTSPRVLVRTTSMMLLLSVLSGCEAPPPPATPVPPPAPPASVEASAPKPVGARWSFAVTETACTAHASNPAVSLTVRVSKSEAVLSVMASAMKSATVNANTRARLRFKGTEGSWTLAARIDSQHAVVAYQHLDDAVVDNVLLLLSGGRLQTEVGTVPVPVLLIPDSNVSGREWFDCVHKAFAR